MGALPIKRYVTKNDTVYERFEDGTATRDGAPIEWICAYTESRVEALYEKLIERGKPVTRSQVEDEFLHTIVYRYPQSKQIKRSSGIKKYENLGKKESEIKLHISDDDEDFFKDLGLEKRVKDL